MAIYKSDIADVNLETGVIHRSFLAHTIGHKDDDADRFGVRTFRDGVPADLSGVSCQAIFMAPDGTNIALTSYGTVSGNEAYVTLPEACYNVEGQFCLAIKLVGGGVTSTVRIVDGVVSRTGATGTVAPTGSVPDYQEILSTYDAMVAATAAANAAAAETFDATKEYLPGKYVVNDGSTYLLPDGHEANVTWANTAKVAATLGDGISNNRNALEILRNGVGSAVKAVPCVFELGYYYTTPAVGETVEKKVSSLYATTMFSVSENDPVTMDATGTTSNSRLYTFFDSNMKALVRCDTNLSGKRTVYAPPGSAYCAVNNRTATQPSGYYAYKGFAEEPVLYKRIVSGKITWTSGKINADGSSGSDSTKIRSTGYYKLGQKLKIYAPSGYSIVVFKFSGMSGPSIQGQTSALQGTAVIDTDPDAYYRFMISATDNSTITTSAAAGFVFTDFGGEIRLESTADTTDRTDDIEALLKLYGHVRLGSGVFCTTGITMPDSSMIEGEGNSTVLFLTGTSDGNAISMGNQCTVRNMQIRGRETDYIFGDETNPAEDAETVPSTPGGRNGVYQDAGYRKGIIENCYIHGFSGGAIAAYGNSSTGTSSDGGLLIKGCLLEWNSAGIYFKKYSEFHIVENCTSSRNYYGVINCGGNNTFVGCNFSKLYYGFYFNNANSDYPNNMHGLLSGCEFKHIYTRTIYINNTGSSFLFTACQFGSSSEQPGGIELVSAGSMRFAECIASDNFPISITNGGLTVFSGWSFQKPMGACAITNNTKVRFTGCFDTDGAAVDPTQN